MSFLSQKENEALLFILNVASRGVWEHTHDTYPHCPYCDNEIHEGHKSNCVFLENLKSLEGIVEICRTCKDAGSVVFISGKERKLQPCPTCNGNSTWRISINPYSETGPRVPPVLDYIQWSEGERERNK